MKKILAAAMLLSVCVAVLALSPTINPVSISNNELPSTPDEFVKGMREAKAPNDNVSTQLSQTELEREVQGLTIDMDESLPIPLVTLIWDEVPGALGYKVYSSQYPGILSFSEDLSGTFTGSSWTTSISQQHSFYYVTALTAGITNSLIYVHGGTFTMGDTRGGLTYLEQPTHTVILNSFYLAKYPVTQAEYTAVMNSHPAFHYGAGDSYPVYGLRWYSALQYCNLRSINEGLSPVYTISGSTDPADWGAVPTDYNTVYNAPWNAAICNWTANGYRLPTEAEWEYAARGAANNPDYLYSGSDDLNAVGWYLANSGNSSHPVGSKSPNALGLYDMSGNLYEWCWDWWDQYYYSSSPSNNPKGPNSGLSRAKRGGYWGQDANFSRVARRSAFDPYRTAHYIGFRVCRSGL